MNCLKTPILAIRYASSWFIILRLLVSISAIRAV